MKKNGFTLIELLLVVIALVVIPLIGYGYINNIVQFAKCDFKEPHRAEIMRGIGIAIAPVGVVEGYLTIEDK